MEEEPTLVVFRKWRDTGNIIALFPQEPAAYDGCTASLTNTDYHQVIRATRPATAE
jgi:hypothetical protein